MSRHIVMLIAAVIFAAPAAALDVQPDGASGSPPSYPIVTAGGGGYAGPVRSPVPPEPKDWEFIRKALDLYRAGKR